MIRSVTFEPFEARRVLKAAQQQASRIPARRGAETVPVQLSSVPSQCSLPSDKEQRFRGSAKKTCRYSAPE